MPYSFGANEDLPISALLGGVVRCPLCNQFNQQSIAESSGIHWHADLNDRRRNHICLKIRKEGQKTTEITARELANGQSYPEPRHRRKTKIFSYEAPDEEGDKNGADEIRIDFFALMDSTATSLRERFSHLGNFESKFGFVGRKPRIQL